MKWEKFLTNTRPQNLNMVQKYYLQLPIFKIRVNKELIDLDMGFENIL